MSAGDESEQTVRTVDSDDSELKVWIAPDMMHTVHQIPLIQGQWDQYTAISLTAGRRGDWLP
jgi:uncharacterized protein YpmB